jgi:hypothetical protein
MLITAIVPNKFFYKRNWRPQKEPGQIITAGIGMAQPKDKTQHRFLAKAEEIIGGTAVEQDIIENLVSQWNLNSMVRRYFVRERKITQWKDRMF